MEGSTVNRFIWVPAEPKRKPREIDLFESGVILAGCLMGMAIMVLLAWIF
jgi:hypothetical protein